MAKGQNEQIVKTVTSWQGVRYQNFEKKITTLFFIPIHNF